jgi:hypothetical protein
MKLHGITFGHLQMLCKRFKATLRLNVHARIAMSNLLPVYLPLLAMTTSVRLVCHQISSLTLKSSMLIIPCGMVKIVVQLAHAANSTIHHGFVNNYLSQLILISKSDCAQVFYALYENTPIELIENYVK